MFRAGPYPGVAAHSLRVARPDPTASRAVEARRARRRSRARRPARVTTSASTRAPHRVDGRAEGTNSHPSSEFIEVFGRGARRLAARRCSVQRGGGAHVRDAGVVPRVPGAGVVGHVGVVRLGLPSWAEPCC